MRSRVKDAGAFCAEVYREFQADGCPSAAAALAFYTVFSVAPLLVVVIVVAGLFLSPERASDEVHAQFLALVGADGAAQVRAMVEDVQQNPGSTVWARVLGVITMLTGASGVMLQLQTALNRAWNVIPDPKQGGAWRFVRKRILSFGLILAIAFLLLVSLVLTAVATAVSDRAATMLPDGWSLGWSETAHFVVSLVVASGLFATLYKVVPEAQVRWGDVAIGAAVTGLLFTIGKVLIGFYLGNSHIGRAWGAASSLAVLLVWVYYSSLIVMLGAEFTQVWTRRYGGGRRPPEPGAIVAIVAQPSL